VINLCALGGICWCSEEIKVFMVVW
jgi:hypothetical protein